MKEQIKLQLQKLDNREISMEDFVENIREISNLPLVSASKKAIIEEYLENVKVQKELKHKADNIRSYKKWLSNPENKKKRSEKDKARYLRNKELAHKKKKDS